MLVDNVLWGGAVVDPSDEDADTQALREVSLRAGRDERVEARTATVCDGLLIAAQARGGYGGGRR